MSSVVSTALQAYFVKAVEDRPILSAEYPSSTFVQNWAILQRGLSAKTELGLLDLPTLSYIVLRF